MRVLVTGATGFVGKALLDNLSTDIGNDCLGIVRSYPQDSPANHNLHVVRDISDSVAWGDLLSNRDVVIHTAARVHVMCDKGGGSLREFHQVNVIGTLALARLAAAAGVHRFVFISTVKVLGEFTCESQPFTAISPPNPAGAYAKSKYEAELGLMQISVETGMDIVIIRPPLVYGPGVKANFLRMIHWVERGIPLPLGAIHNKRSFVALDNLIDLIVTCIDHPAAANQVFLAGDGEDLSTSDLLRGIARAMGKPSRLIPFPERFLRLGAKLIGKKALADRLLGSLQVDISKARDLLGWEPPLSVEEGLKRCFEAENNR
ncbi:UDP-glucose 4-epimerase family protein [Amphritea pacifica]|uniref:UDP-glucose 4-epimerase family protein n=1 Tax=Amphritea pacifica TaxID=2811233 RepID=UPI001963B634|nr:SDR family oxidoreductase [Amphritea pacifica]